MLGGPQFRREDGLIPATSIAGRSLMTVITIMTLLAALSAALSLMVFDASADWRAAVSQEMTAQIRPAAGRDLDADVAAAVAATKAFPGLADASALDKAEPDALLEPWLGKLDLAGLPVPRLIVLRLDPGKTLDLAGLRAALRAAAPTATLDDHRFWLERLARMANALAVGAALIFVLILVAIATAVAFATRGAMAGAREIVDVLHFVGAADDYIARQFQSHFFRLGGKGAAIGAACAMFVFLIARLTLRSATDTATEMQFDVLFGSFAIGWRGMLAVAIVAAGIAALTALVSRWIVLRRLRGAE
ncbi:MAG: ABC transporter permease [Rhodoblastus sp.]|nr:MAG: ABC transporter permease [Rhodoblastus sp.]